MEMYTPYKIKFNKFDFVSLTRLEIKKSIYDHTRVNIKGVISEDKVKDYRRKLTKEDPKLVITYNEDETNILFKGIIEEYDINHENYDYYLELKAVSYSKLLARGKKTRVYQNKGTTYKEVFKKINEESEADFNITCADNSLNQKALISEECPVILQYKESDWNFLKRISSYLNQIVVVDDIKDDSEPINILLGSHAAPPKELNNISGSKKKKTGNRDNNYIYYKVNRHEQFRSEEIFSPGKPVKYRIDNESKEFKELIVIKNRLYLDKGILYSDLTLVEEKDINTAEQKRELPPEGVSLKAKVKEVNDKHRTQVEFIDVDNEYDKSASFWFHIDKPYTNAYFAPEKEDIVDVYFKGRKEKYAAVKSSNNDNGEETDNPSHIKRMYLGEREIKLDRKNKDITITGAEEKVFLNLTNDKIKMENEKQQMEVSGEEMKMANKSNSVIMDNDKVNVEGDEGVLTMDSTKTQIDFGSKKVNINKSKIDLS